MKRWICIDEDKLFGKQNWEYDGTRETVDQRFNICHGLEPMRENVFVYVIREIITHMYDGYLCVSYEPARPDGVSAVQCARPMFDEKINTEIVMIDESSKRGFRIYNKKDMTLRETLDVFWKVLVEYKCPDLSGWVETTEIAKYLEE